MEKSAKSNHEEVKELALKELFPFPDHPFQVQDDAAMFETVQSIQTYGIMTPIIVRPREEGGYEIVSGHRRTRACELAGLETIPAIVRNMDRDAAIIMMVDSNLQRENILPSERARAYKMKLAAIKRQGKRTDLTGGQVGHKSREDISDEDSGRTIQRYIRLTELTPELQQMVDDKKIAFTPAVELSYLSSEEQSLLLETIESEQSTPSLSQAQRMKKLSQRGELNEDSMLDIMMEQKKPERNDVIISGEKLRKYFPRSYTPRQIEDAILKIVDNWYRKKQRGKER